LSRKRAGECIEAAKKAYARNYNRKRGEVIFQVGDWVLLSTKNLKPRGPSRKLSEKFLGPYKIMQVVGHYGLAFHLKLPSRARRHDVFPISSLEPYHAREGDPPLGSQEIPSLDEPTYDVEEILDHKGPLRSRKYLVKWEGYGLEESSWESKGQFESPIWVEEYKAKIRRPRVDLQARDGDDQKDYDGLDHDKSSSRTNKEKGY
jgi:hypothetical protein